MEESEPQLEALDGALLTTLVQRALNRGPVELLDWRWARIAYDRYLPGRTLARVAGTALVDGGISPWSLVLKVVRPPEGSEDARDDSWKREALAYQSGLLADLPGSLTAARALAVTEDDAGAVWLWLEDVADSYGRRWPLEQYGRAARHLGQFNGAYLVTRPLPAHQWLAPRWAESHSEPAMIPAALTQVAALATDARVRRAFPGLVAEAATRLLHDQSAFVGLLARLPQTLCHHDASRANLFARRSLDGTMVTVAIDWESLGHGTVGAEIATLVFGTIRRGHFPAEHVAALDEAVFAGYLQGLRDAGWQGNPDLMRLGYAAAVALRWFLLRGTLRAIADDDARHRIARVLEEPEEHAVRRLILLSTYLLACADEARGLARRYGLLR